MKRQSFVKGMLGFAALGGLTSVNALGKLLNEEDYTYPVLFIGHGSPMNGIQDTSFSRQWKKEVEHLPNPQETMREIYRKLGKGGLFLFATPHPEYSLRRFKDRENDAIGKDKTHINCHVPAVWKAWGEEAGFRVVKQWGDGLWDVPYLPVIPNALQFAFFGFPAFLQVMSQSSFIPLSLGVNQVNILLKSPN